MTLDIDLFRGELVRLAAAEPEDYSRALSTWRRDSYLLRLWDSEPAQMFTVRGQQQWLEKDWLAFPPDTYFFTIRTLEDDRLIGDTSLENPIGGHRESFIGIGLGKRDDWGKGYGTDAMRIMLRYAFTELNLHRVTLNTFEYNPRAVRSYEKAGFRHEGRERGVLHRDGRRWDLIYMGILRSEWQSMNGGS